jgi:hypothetical protein
MKHAQSWQPRPGALQDQTREFTEAWRAVATAKLNEFRRQCWHLAGLVQQGLLEKVLVVDQLEEIAVSHGLVYSFGDDRIAAIIAEAFAGVEFNPFYAAEAVA